jgi:hypothetical protein
VNVEKNAEGGKSAEFLRLGLDGRIVSIYLEIYLG